MNRNCDTIIFSLVFGSPNPFHQIVLQSWKNFTRANFYLLTDKADEWREFIGDENCNLNILSISIEDFFANSFRFVGVRTEYDFMERFGSKFYHRFDSWTARGLRPLLHEMFIHLFLSENQKDRFANTDLEIKIDNANTEYSIQLNNEKYLFWGWIDAEVIINQFALNKHIENNINNDLLLFPETILKWEHFKIVSVNYDLKNKYIKLLNETQNYNSPLDAQLIYALTNDYKLNNCDENCVCSHWSYSDAIENIPCQFDVTLYSNGKLVGKQGQDVIFFLADTEMRDISSDDVLRLKHLLINDGSIDFSHNLKIEPRQRKNLIGHYVLYSDNLPEPYAEIELLANAKIVSNKEELFGAIWEADAQNIYFKDENNIIICHFEIKNINACYYGEWKLDAISKAQKKLSLKRFAKRAPLKFGFLNSVFDNINNENCDCDSKQDYTIFKSPAQTYKAVSEITYFDNCTKLEKRAVDVIDQEFTSSEAFYHVLHNVTLYNNGIIECSNGIVIGETAYQAELRSRSHEYLAKEYDNEIGLPFYEKVEEIVGTWLLFNTMLENYGHFHLQSLCNIDILKECSEKFGELNIICTDSVSSASDKHFQPYRNQIFDYFGLNVKRMLNPLKEKGRIFKIERLIVPSSVCVPKNEKFNGYYVNVLKKYLIKNSEFKNKRYLLSRSDVGSKRNIENFSDLELELIKLDFETIVIGNLPYQEQMTILKDAEIVVAPHGGNLTNIISHSGGLKVFEIMHSGEINAWYKNLAVLCGHRYGLYCVDPKNDNWDSSFVVNPVKLREAVEKFINL
jgi:Glycosyltransferase 61